MIHGLKRHEWKRWEKKDPCEKLLGCFVMQALHSSTPQDDKMAKTLKGMHTCFCKELFDLERKCWVSASEREPTSPGKWSMLKHKLVTYLYLFSVAASPGNASIWKCLDSPKDKMRRIRKLISGTKQLKEFSSSKYDISCLMPKARQLSLEVLHLGALHVLKGIDTFGSSHREARNIDLLSMVLERFSAETFPLDVLLLVDEPWDEKMAVWKQLRRTRTTRTSREWNSVVSHLPNKYKKYVKFVLLSLKRYKQFTMRYVCPDPSHIKCTRDLDERKISEFTLTFCGFCRELLTYVDMGKRPPSFGHYLNIDTLKQFCHRDDSDRLHLLRCFDEKRMVNLEFGHPDRHCCSVCMGRRSCFALSGYPDGWCTSCTHNMSELELHKGTCLGDESKSENMCKGCRFVFERDQGVIDRLKRAKEERQKEEELETKMTVDNANKKKLDTAERQRGRMLYLFQKAEAMRDRQKLIK